MATVNETMMQDAVASIETSYVMSIGDTFEGNLSSKTDEDWVAVELEAGTTYRINLTGTEGEGGSGDTILSLYDSKGGLVDTNDDINPVGSEDNPANLNSQLMFTPEEDGTYYISAGSYADNPLVDNSGTYTIEIVALDLPADIEGTAASEKIAGTDGVDKISGGDGNDTIDAMGGDDEIDGGDGNDLITGGPGADMIKGGDHFFNAMGVGGDTISYEYSSAGVNINLRAGTASGGDAEGDSLGDDIENVRGSMHDDTLSGSRGKNLLWGFGGNDDLFGDKGDDSLSGGAGDDNLDGGDGDDTLEGGYGADTLTGGEDDDTASYTGSMMGVTVRLHTSQAMGGDAEGDTWGDTVTVDYVLPDEDGMDVEYEETVPDIVHLTGSGMADILAGDSRANTIKGGGGDDKLYGGPGGGDDVLMGGRGDDMIFGGPGGDFLHGDAGDDMLNGGPGIDEYYGGAGSDMIYAGNEDAIVNGWLAGQVDDGDTGDVDESMESEVDPMTVDTVSYARLKAGVMKTLEADGISNIENIIGTDENDTLTGAAGPNVINGLDGADALSGGDAVDGTDAGDTVSYENSDRGVTITVNADGAGSASGGHAQGDTITNFENATGSAHDDNLNGEDDAATENTLKGLAGDDEIIGGAGSDTIEGGAGADEMDGGTTEDAGNGITITNGKTPDGRDGAPDTLSYANSYAGVTVSFTTLTFSGGHAEGDEVEVQRDAFDPDGEDGDGDPVDVSTFENITGSDHNDRLTGDHRANELNGGKGNDNLRGMAGADTLNGGPGADNLDGGEDARERDNMVPDPADTDPSDGTDMIAASIDIASYAGAMSGITVNLDNGRGTAGDAMGDTLDNIEKVVGSSNDDLFLAGEEADNIDGGAHNGDDPAGGDEEDGDTVSYEESDEAVTVDLGLQATNAAQLMETTDDQDQVQNEGINVDGSFAAGDFLAGIENLTGSDYDDTLTGDINANILRGGAGDDMLLGDSARDNADSIDNDQDNPLVPIDDMMYGGDGDDILIGNTGDDLLEGGDGDDYLYGGKGPDDTGGGLRGRDILRGGAGDDYMDGGSWGDAFSGGTGDDVIVTGSGSDWSYFGPGHGFDIITDFDNSGNDRIVLRDFEEITSIDDLDGMIRQRGEDVVIDLEAYGGGTILLYDITLDLDGTDGTTDLTAGDFVFAA